MGAKSAQRIALVCLLLCALSASTSAPGERAPLEGKAESQTSSLLSLPTSYRSRKSRQHSPSLQGCYLHPGKRECLRECGFNASAKTILIIHGWTIGGVFESWMYQLVAAVRQRELEANLIVVDWLDLAHQLYPDAVSHTRHVGLSIAALLDWLQSPVHHVVVIHMIGYSLGAHVAGYAGNFVQGTVGRITGLDPAGPMFEGVEAHRRLSPDDADFVDVLHTYTREALGVSIGIQQPIGDIDIYPNGGDVQPGCTLGEVLSTAAAGNFMDVMKCEHERSVHLFVDSLLNSEYAGFAFQCTGPDRFNKGICLSCRKNRCNSVGYSARKMRKKRNSKMYLKTRADTPFAGYHYQMKMHIFNRKMPVLHAAVAVNFTNTFLVFTEEDIGELLRISLIWESPMQSFSAVWKRIKTSLWSWSSKMPKQVLEVRKIRVKSGESQKKYTFCTEDLSLNEISPGKEISFVKCRDGWEVKPKR
uniref:PLAT domain-containing protein n=1 Tax=Electrophorus electricus TaxID=8005 RepID=A0A4W4GK51_ELEEL